MDREDLLRMHAEVCKSLAVPTRLLIIDALRAGEHTVTDLCRHLHLPQATVSRHLALLRERRLVRVRHQGPFAYYSVASPKLIAAMDLLGEVMAEANRSGQQDAGTIPPLPEIRGKRDGQPPYRGSAPA